MDGRKDDPEFSCNPVLAEAFKKGMKPFKGKLGLCCAAALLQFLESDPAVQRDLVQRVFETELNEEMEAAIESALAEQQRKIKKRREQRTSRAFPAGIERFLRRRGSLR